MGNDSRNDSTKLSELKNERFMRDVASIGVCGGLMRCILSVYAHRSRSRLFCVVVCIGRLVKCTVCY